MIRITTTTVSGFLDWFFSFMTTMIDGFWKIISGFANGIAQIFNIATYIAQFKSFKGSFNFIDWIFTILSILMVVAIYAIIVYLIVLGARKYIRFRRSAVGSEDLLEEVANLHRDVLRLTKEKERILALKIGQTSVSIEDINAIFADDEEKPEDAVEEKEEKEELPADLPVRFSRLDAIDQKYKD